MKDEIALGAGMSAWIAASFDVFRSLGATEKSVLVAITLFVANTYSRDAFVKGLDDCLAAGKKKNQ